MRFDVKYAPKSLSQVFGQPKIVSQLLRLREAPGGKAILISGATGIGKTLIAGLLAKDILCENPGGGEQCQQAPQACASCQQFDAGGSHAGYLAIDCARHGGKDDIEPLLGSIRQSPGIFARYRIIHLDEAQCLSAPAMESLLIEMERLQKFVLVILTTTAPEKLSQPLRARCDEYPLSPPLLETQLEFLRSVCSKEQCTFEDSALVMLAEHPPAGYRAPLKRLGQVLTNTRHVSRAAVKDLLMSDRERFLEAYVEALTQGEIDAQARAMEQSALSPADIHAAIQDLFASAHTDLLLGQRTPANEQSSVLHSHFQRRAAQIQAAETQIWSEAVDHWTDRPADLSKALLKNKILRFGHLMSMHEEPVAGEGAGPTDNAIASAANPRKHVLKTPRRATPVPARRPMNGFLTRAQIAELWNAASFGIQEYGRPLNVRLLFDHGQLGLDQRKAQQLTAGFIHEASLACKRWTATLSGECHFLYAHAHGQRSGLTTLIVGHVPAHLSTRFVSWFKESFVPRWLPEGSPHRSASLRITGTDTSIRRHVILLRLLCRGVDPGILVTAGGTRKPLIDVLGIPRRIREPMTPLALPQRWRVTKTVGASARHHCREERLPVLSAFDDAAWAFLTTGWEFDEYRDRRQERQSRSTLLRQIDDQWPEGQGPLQDARRNAILAQRKQSWSDDPRMRRRSWKGWWVKW
jgi:DNA polymerase III gamma/tau subunit